MNCELCGSNIRGDVQVVNIDGGMFRVCNSCSRLGTPARVPKPSGMGRGSPSSSRMSSGGSLYGSGPSSRNSASASSQKPRSPSPSYGSASYDNDEDLVLREDYSKAIKTARELLGITQEELGRKINEKPSVISHLEVGSMKPTDELARRLEHFLKIDLFVSEEDAEAGLASDSQTSSSSSSTSSTS